ncbi:hypothetical protein MMC26_006253 [Xylographa opegraphella]|nr:hypothetical protein [Xylographa opegraphella]
MDCQANGIDASSVFEKERVDLFSDPLLDEAFMQTLTQAWESEQLLYGETMPQLTQEHQTYVNTSGTLGHQAPTPETADERQKDWALCIGNNNLGQNQQSLRSTQIQRQRQTKDTPVSTAELGHKRKQHSRSHEHSIDKKYHRRRKAQNRTEKMAGSQGQNLEEWIVISQPIQKQGRNSYRTYACQELILMQQSPQRLSMIAKELAQDFALDSTLEQETPGIEVLQRRQLYREWRDQSCQGLRLVSRGACTPTINDEQMPATSNIMHPVAVDEKASSERAMGQPDAEETQILNVPQNLELAQTTNPSIIDETIEVQPEILQVDQDHDGYRSLEFEEFDSMMNATFADLWWTEAEQYEVPIISSTGDRDASLC